MANVGNTSGSWFLFNLLLHSILKRTFKNSSETRSFSETSRSRDETETLKNRVSRHYSSGFSSSRFGDKRHCCYHNS